MGIACCGCQCGSTDSLIRNTLKNGGYEEWLNVPIAKGKSQSRSLLSSLPQLPEIRMLDSFLERASKWAVIIGWDGESCRWADVAHGGVKSKIEAEFIIKEFG